MRSRLQTPFRTCRRWDPVVQARMVVWRWCTDRLFPILTTKKRLNVASFQFRFRRNQNEMNLPFREVALWAVSCSDAGASPPDGEDGRADGPGKSFRIERPDEEPDGPDETEEEQECPAA